MFEYPGNPYNPTMNPYLAAAAQHQFQQAPRQEVTKVNGEGGARAYPMGANSSALLLDESGVIVWVVTTDGAGYKSVAAYDITPHQAAPQPDFNSLEARISKLEEVINNASTDSATSQRPEQTAGSQHRPNQGGNR